MADQAEPEGKISGRTNWMAVGIGAAMLAAAVAAIAFTFYFIDQERQRDLQAWQVRLGIVADSRSAAVNEWVEQNFAIMRELTENASLQLYMTELAMAEGDRSDVTDEPAQAGYLRNLLVATADRTGFKPPPAAGEIAANIERVGVAGIGLVDAGGRSLVGTPGMPPVSGKIRKAVAKALSGEPAMIDIYMGASNLPTMGFSLPVFAVQDESEGTEGIGAVVGMRIIGKELFDRLEQPGGTEATTETYLARSASNMVEYLSPLADGTPPLKRSLALDTPDLAASFALATPGGFAIKQDYAGEEVLVTSRPIANLPWLLVRKISRAEALADTESRLTTILTVALLVIGGIGVTIVAVWRHGSSLRATAALEKSRIAAERFENMSKFMRLVTNSQPTVIAAVDGTTTYTFANQPAAAEAGIPAEDMLGKTMASIIGPVKAKVLADINDRILRNFADSDDTDKERQSHITTLGDEGEEEDLQIIKSDHIPLRGDRDHPPGVLMILDDITELTRERRRSEQMLKQLINTLVSVVDRRDPFSAHHSTRVAEVSLAIAGEMNTPELVGKTAEIAGSLMYLGKIFVPPELLTKTGDLSAEERDMLANSYLVSADLLRSVPFNGPVVDTIEQMGEKWDGTGPMNLHGEEIILPARVLAVANAFVGMISPRAYRGAMTFEKVSKILLGESNSKFDRKPISALINFLDNRGGTEVWAHYRERPESADE